MVSPRPIPCLTSSTPCAPTPPSERFAKRCARFTERTRKSALPKPRAYFACLLIDGLYNDCCPISQNFRDALHHFRRVIADANDGVRSEIGGVPQHQFECLGTGALA